MYKTPAPQTISFGAVSVCVPWSGADQCHGLNCLWLLPLTIWFGAEYWDLYPFISSEY